MAFLKGTELVRIDNMFKIALFVLNEQNQNRTTRTGDTACQRLRDVITLGLWRHTPTAGNNIICYNFFFYCGSTSVRHTNHFSSVALCQLKYTHCERRMFVLYSSACDGRGLCYYPISCNVAFFDLWKFSQVVILKAENCVFFSFGSYQFRSSWDNDIASSWINLSVFLVIAIKLIISINYTTDYTI